MWRKMKPWFYFKMLIWVKKWIIARYKKLSVIFYFIVRINSTLDIKYTVNSYYGQNRYNSEKGKLEPKEVCIKRNKERMQKLAYNHYIILLEKQR